MDITLYTLPLVFIHHHIQAVHVIVELVPTGKVLLPRLHLTDATNMVLPVLMFTKLISTQTVNLFPVSLINLFQSVTFCESLTYRFRVYHLSCDTALQLILHITFLSKKGAAIILPNVGHSVYLVVSELNNANITLLYARIFSATVLSG